MLLFFSVWPSTWNSSSFGTVSGYYNWANTGWDSPFQNRWTPPLYHHFYINDKIWYYISFKLVQLPIRLKQFWELSSRRLISIILLVTQIHTVCHSCPYVHMSTLKMGMSTVKKKNHSFYYFLLLIKKGGQCLLGGIWTAPSFVHVMIATRDL